MKNLSHFLLCLLMVLTMGAVTAQERAATGPMDTQMTWAALSDKINGIDTRVNAANTRMDQFVICGRKGMLYAPGATGADGQGCLTATISPTSSLVKFETKTFTESNRGGQSSPMADTNAYCVSKGYQVSTASSYIQTYGQNRCGPHGETCDGLTNSGYTISCLRAVAN